MVVVDEPEFVVTGGVTTVVVPVDVVDVAPDVVEVLGELEPLTVLYNAVDNGKAASPVWLGT